MPRSPDLGDVGLVKQAAHDFLDRYGTEAPAEQRNRAELAAAIGDELSTETWLDIVDAVADLLMADRSDTCASSSLD